MLGLTAIFKLVALGGVVITALFFTGKKFYDEYDYRQSIKKKHELSIKCIKATQDINKLYLCYEDIKSKK